MPGTKKRKCFLRPKSEWQRKELPELRIVDDALWSRVQIRIQETRVASKNIRNALHQQARTGRPTRYPLSGLMKCRVCGSSYIMADKYAYACSAYKHGHACENHIRVRRETAENRILEVVKNHLLSERQTEKMRTLAVKRVKSIKLARASKNTGKAIKVELAMIDKKLGNLVNFIAEHGHDDTVKAELDRLESRRNELPAELQTEPCEFDKLPDLIPKLMERWRNTLSNLAQIQDSASVTQAARLKSFLRRMLGEIPLEPIYDEGYLMATVGLTEKALIQEIPGISALAAKSGSGGVICTVPTITTRIRLK